LIAYKIVALNAESNIWPPAKNMMLNMMSSMGHQLLRVWEIRIGGIRCEWGHRWPEEVDDVVNRPSVVEGSEGKDRWDAT
jgi:hypothetical protein